MPKLTDDQLGDLLRETFADHTDDLHSLPEATKPRRFAPVLVAAAVVLTALGSTVLSGSMNTARLPASSPPSAIGAARVSPDDDVQVWSTVASMILKQEAPSKPVILAATDAKISSLQRQQISAAVGQGAWSTDRWAALRDSPQAKAEKLSGCADPHSPVVVFGKVTGKGHDREVRVGISDGCGREQSALYRLEKQDGIWMIEAVSDVKQSIP